MIALALQLMTDISYEIFGWFKPITIIQYSGFLSFALFLRWFRKPIARISKNKIDMMIIISFLIIMATLFEMMWSFGYWFSTYELNIMSKNLPQNSQVLDEVVYYPSKIQNRYLFDESFSLNLSAKKNTLFFMMSVYFTFFLITIKNDKKFKFHT